MSTFIQQQTLWSQRIKLESVDFTQKLQLLLHMSLMNLLFSFQFHRRPQIYSVIRGFAYQCITKIQIYKSEVVKASLRITYLSRLHKITEDAMHKSLVRFGVWRHNRCILMFKLIAGFPRSYEGFMAYQLQNQNSIPYHSHQFPKLNRQESVPYGHAFQSCC